jgi:16S rRNA (cytosine1402-N4)-methyltransferase
MHIPVLLKETLEFLDLKEGKFIIDGTVDGGGHSSEIIKKIGPNGKLLGLDWDKDMMSLANKNLRKLAKENKVELILVNKNYAELIDVLKDKNLGLADGLLLDLGFSSLHVESSGRGFSFLRNEPLIMTYNDNSLPAYEFLKRVQFNELSKILKNYGEERYAVQIAKKIIEKRRIQKIKNTFDLVEVIKEAVPLKYLHQKIHPATKTFQALRIYLNNELENLKKVLSEIKNIVLPGGRIVIISFHSLEDRIVKNFFKEMFKNKKLEILTKKPVTPKYEEIKNNLKSRSAKLRSGVIL